MNNNSDKWNFINGGERLELKDPSFIPSADADLWNDKLFLHIDHLGNVKRHIYLTPNQAEYSERLRQFYIRDNETGKSWQIPGGLKNKDADFNFSVGKADLKWTIIYDSIKVEITVVVPRDDITELWNVTIQNLDTKTRDLSLYTYFPIGRRSGLSQEMIYNSELKGGIVTLFPYYVHSKDYYKLKEGWNNIFFIGDNEPTSYMFSIEDFNLESALEIPVLPKPANRESDNETVAGIMQYSQKLTTEESKSFNWAFGPAKNIDDIKNIQEKYLSSEKFDLAKKSASDFIESHTSALQIQTPDKDFDAFFNHWQPRRSLMYTRTLRFNYAPQGRNVIQDAMGGALINPESSRKWFSQIWKHQHSNGWLPHGIPFAENIKQAEINSIPHKDINSWGPSALTFYMNETGDESILDEMLPFADKQENVSIYEHICLGLEWLLNDRTKRGLCRIGQGDWNDPLNMAGENEEGESIWLSEALIYALECWIDICKKRSDTNRAVTYKAEADKLKAAINEFAWDGEWYVRGFTDEGKAFGTKKDDEGKIFLNAQTWAIMSGTANEDRSNSCIKSVEKWLDTPAGPMTLAPAFTSMREDIGKLTQKLPGWNENGSVYCHATAFYAYALYFARKTDKAWDVLRNLLTGTEKNPISRTGQLPLYVPNFYRGTPSGRKAGQSSHLPNSGTAAWYYRAVVDMLFGLRAESDGMRIDPQLPHEWKCAKATRNWRGNTYEVDYKTNEAADSTIIEVNGEILKTNLIPYEEGKKHYKINITLPTA